jgi:cation diffusion facilitator family transporter
MTNPGKKATLIGIAANAFLFCIKMFAGLLSGSLALISDAINSLSDTIYSIAVFIAVKVSHKSADKEHPFGHHRAEPVAGLMIAILMGIVGFEIVKAGSMGLTAPAVNTFTLFGVFILLITMALKAGMWFYFKRTAKRINSPAIAASSVDSRNDILISFTTLLGISGAYLGVPHLDSYAAILIGLFIIWSGYRIGAENIDYLMGKTPEESVIREIEKCAKGVRGVLGIHDVRAHYVGNFIHVEVHVEVDKDLHTDKAHAICTKAKTAVEGVPSVDKAFIHIDPAKPK